MRTFSLGYPDYTLLCTFLSTLIVKSIKVPGFNKGNNTMNQQQGVILLPNVGVILAYIKDRS